MSTDWEKIKEAYIASQSTTLKQLAQRHDLPFGEVAKRSAQEGWYREKKRKNELTAALKAQAQSTLAQHERHALVQSDKINRIAGKLLDNIDLSSEYADKPTGIYNLSSALKNLTAVLRDVNDIPNVKDERTYELTKRKLELAAQKEAPEQAEGGVVLLPEVQRENEFHAMKSAEADEIDAR